MAGHSKWANIKFRKAAQDAKRGKAFSKLIKEITVAARLGGGDADANPRLRSAMDKALAANMTRDTITRAVKRGSGDSGSSDFTEIKYEGYGPGGIAVLVEVATDNRNRAVGEVRHAFAKHHGNLGTDGSVAYLFARVGLLVFTGGDEDKIMEIAIGAGAEDVDSDGEIISVITAENNFLTVESEFKQHNMAADFAEIIYQPQTQIEVRGDVAAQVNKLIQAIEQIDDVQNVFTNAIFTDDNE